MTEQPPPQQTGVVVAVLNAVKGMSLTNVLVILVLAVVLLPSYLMWRMLNDPAMLGRFLSSYEEVTSDKWPCTLRIASLRGAGDTFSISAGFAYQGSDRWTLAVLMDRDPRLDENVMQSYCETLQLLIDYMRDPKAHPPPFPNSEDPMVHMYPNGQ
jgi:hypothetical protein